MDGGKKKQSCPFSSVPEIFPESALHCQRLPMSSSVKDVIVDAGGKRDSGIPFSPAPCPRKTRLRFGFPQLLTLT